MRAALFGATGLIGAMAVLLAPTASSAQSTTADPNGFAYGFQVQLWHYDPVARSNVLGDVTQAGFNWMTQQIDWGEVEVEPGNYYFSQLDNIAN